MNGIVEQVPRSFERFLDFKELKSNSYSIKLLNEQFSCIEKQFHFKCNSF